MFLESTVIGSLIGLGGSFATAVGDYFKTKQSNEHELAMMQMQKELADAERAFNLEKLDSENALKELQAVYSYASTPTGTWVDALAASVRPSITYAYFAAYLLAKVAMFVVGWNDEGIAGGNMILQLWTPADMGMFSTILAFWFGNRSLRRPKQ